MGRVAVQQMAEKVADLLEERLRLRGRDLAAKVRRGGRLLPRKVRRAAVQLADAAATAQNPKLMGQIDPGKIDAAYDACVRYLLTIDPAKRRRDSLAGMVESVGLGVLALGLGVSLLLWWQGAV